MSYFLISLTTSNVSTPRENKLYFKCCTLHTELVWLWGKKTSKWLISRAKQSLGLLDNYVFDWIIIGFGTNTAFGASSGSTFGTATASGGGLFGGGTSGRRNYCSKNILWGKRFNYPPSYIIEYFKQS